jgi:hypothetical protein
MVAPAALLHIPDGGALTDEDPQTHEAVRTRRRAGGAMVNAL